MAEQVRSAPAALTPVAQKFILHWGEMGTKWGINRTVAQVHALLFLSPHPLPADEISTTLAVARSNVSTSLRELQGWGIAGSSTFLETDATILKQRRTYGKSFARYRKSASAGKSILRFVFWLNASRN